MSTATCGRYCCVTVLSHPIVPCSFHRSERLRVSASDDVEVEPRIEAAAKAHYEWLVELRQKRADLAGAWERLPSYMRSRFCEQMAYSLAAADAALTTRSSPESETPE
jgi:hypothetical protein